MVGKLMELPINFLPHSIIYATLDDEEYSDNDDSSSGDDDDDYYDYNAYGRMKPPALTGRYSLESCRIYVIRLSFVRLWACFTNQRLNTSKV
jgi:hypothetical protein